VSRPGWNEYFLQIAKVVASRATCDRLHVGAVIVRDRQILSTGYNGAPKGLPSCDDAGHELKDMGGRQSCVRSAHAETNAVAQAACNGVAIAGATIYVTASPCYDCAKLIINSGIKQVVYGGFYASRYGNSGIVTELLTAAGVTVDGEQPTSSTKESE
jgi:dCMP deaminase